MTYHFSCLNRSTLSFTLRFVCSRLHPDVEATAQHTSGTGYGGHAAHAVRRRRAASRGGHADAWQGGMGVSVYFGDRISAVLH
ncbi:MAG TPA: hypothetical protein VJ833_02535 [Rhodanobacteraceae bacterium]|nr:hypothetical protein [Rhodanobacteraceae bacterium]